jgi:F0F1-type ATP synthase membrane subunit c/vacuolar-type H+-ATPase subunit K
MSAAWVIARPMRAFLVFIALAAAYLLAALSEGYVTGDTLAAGMASDPYDISSNEGYAHSTSPDMRAPHGVDFELSRLFPAALFALGALVSLARAVRAFLEERAFSKAARADLRALERQKTGVSDMI